MVVWGNGRPVVLRARFLKGSVGSSPIATTIMIIKNNKIVFEALRFVDRFGDTVNLDMDVSNYTEFEMQELKNISESACKIGREQREAFDLLKI